MHVHQQLQDLEQNHKTRCRANASLLQIPTFPSLAQELLMQQDDRIYYINARYTPRLHWPPIRTPSPI